MQKSLHLLLVASTCQAAVFVPGTWTLDQQGLTGVSAILMTVVSENKVVVLDRVEHNALQVDGHVAWATELDRINTTLRPLDPTSNTWCSTGGFLSNGTMISTGGNPVVITGDNGLQAVRLFTPCDDNTCDFWENQNTTRLTSKRWYPSSLRVQDGSIMIMGGSFDQAYFNNVTYNNPTYEFFPPKNINGFNGTQIPIQLLIDSEGANQFPNMHLLPDGNIFMAANNRSILFDWRTNTEIKRLPFIPNGVKISSPFSGSAVLLPLNPENNYQPEIFICGGSDLPDFEPLSFYTINDPASNQCLRMTLTPEGIQKGWEVEHMPQGRTMLNMNLLPDGRVVIVNGAQSGIAAYDTVSDRVGESNAANPAFQAVVYNPSAPSGQRFSTDGIPVSTIARMYHSVATLTPFGDIMLAGSNPNADVSILPPFPTEYRVEFLAPPYIVEDRPTYNGLPQTIPYGSDFKLSVHLPPNTTSVSVSLMDLGFSTHGVTMDQRLVKLLVTLSTDHRSVVVSAPPNANIYPPGPAYLFLLTDKGVPSIAKKTIIGTGESPPVDWAASANLLLATPAAVLNYSDPTL